MKKRTVNRRISQATGLVGIGMLTLTGCVGVDDQEAADAGYDDADQDEGGAEGEAEGPDSDAAETDASESDDTDSDDRESDQGEEGQNEEGLDDEGDDLAAGEAPALEDIEDEIWDSSLDQESVTLHVVQQQPEEDFGDREDNGLLGLTPQADDDDGSDQDGDEDSGRDDEDSDRDDEDSNRDDEDAMARYELVYTGDLTGAGSSVEYDYGEVDGVEHQGEILSFEDSAFQSADSFISDLLLSAPEDIELPEQDEIEEAVDREWIDHTDFEIQMNHTAEQYLEELQDSTEMLLLEDSLADLDAEASEGTHDGQDVWIYETEDVEIVVLADEEEPLLLVMDIDTQGIESTIEFTEWNESEGPEAPEDDEVYSAEEAMEIVEDL